MPILTRGSVNPVGCRVFRHVGAHSALLELGRPQHYRVMKWMNEWMNGLDEMNKRDTVSVFCQWEKSRNHSQDTTMNSWQNRGLHLLAFALSHKLATVARRTTMVHVACEKIGENPSGLAPSCAQACEQDGMELEWKGCHLRQWVEVLSTNVPYTRLKNVALC